MHHPPRTTRSLRRRVTTVSARRDHVTETISGTDQLACTLRPLNHRGDDVCECRYQRKASRRTAVNRRPDRVVYIGTFSTTLFPALRLKLVAVAEHDVHPAVSTLAAVIDECRGT
jgi:hypothetical protein